MKGIVLAELRTTLILLVIMTLSLGLAAHINAASSPIKVLRTISHSEVVALAYSPDGKLIVTGGRDQTLRLWEAGTGKELRVLKLSSIPHAVALSSDLLASGEIRAVLFDVRTGTERLRLPTGSVRALQFSPTGKVLATGDADGFVKLWELPSGRLRLRIKDPPTVKTLAFSPDGRMIATGSGVANTYGVKLWDVSSGALRRALGGVDPTRPIGVSGHTVHHFVRTLAFSADGNLIAGWGGTGDRNLEALVTIWEVTSGRTVAQLDEEGVPQALAFSPNGRVLVIPGEKDGRSVLRLWDVRTKKYILTIPMDGELGPVAFSPDGRSLAAAVRALVEIWDMTSLRLGR